MRRTTELRIVRIIIIAFGALMLMVFWGMNVTDELPLWFCLAYAAVGVRLCVVLMRDAQKELRELEADPLERFWRERDGK